MEERGMGVVLKYQNMNKDTIFLALRKALDNKMKENAKQVSFSFKNRPMSPKESAVYWAEYVIKSKGAKLTRPHSGDSHWFIYSNMDIYLFLIVCIIAFISSWILLLKKLFKTNDKKVNDNINKSTLRGRSLEKKYK
jgi:glucuronosyltransferase